MKRQTDDLPAESWPRLPLGTGLFVAIYIGIVARSGERRRLTRVARLDDPRDNLLHAQPTATRADADRVARLTCLTDVLDRWPAGRDTELGPTGAGLSGGERPRAAMAGARLQSRQSSFSTKRRRRLTCSRSGNCWRASSGGAVNASW